MPLSERSQPQFSSSPLEQDRVTAWATPALEMACTKLASRVPGDTTGYGPRAACHLVNLDCLPFFFCCLLAGCLLAGTLRRVALTDNGSTASVLRRAKKKAFYHVGYSDTFLAFGYFSLMVSLFVFFLLTTDYKT